MDPVRFGKLLRRGRGGAVQCLQNHDAQPYLKQIIYALTHNTAHEKQCEGNREEYFKQIAELAGGLAKFRCEILDALKSAHERYDFLQLFESTYILAKNGDREAHQLMYERFAARKPMNCNDVFGAMDLMELDGADALIYVARVIGKRSLDNPEFGKIDRPWYAEEILGKKATSRILGAARKNDKLVEAYCQSFEREDSAPNSNRPGRLDVTSRSIKEIIDAIRTGTLALIDRDKWRRIATDEDYKNVARSLSEEANPQFQLRLLRVFNYKRRFPLDPHIVMPLLDSADSKVADVAAQVLSAFDDVILRSIALEKLASKQHPDRYIYLLRRTYQDGDHLAIEEALPNEPTHDEFVHALGFALTEIFDDNFTICCLESMLWIYEHDPCSLCRGRAVRILLDTGIAPDWLLEEACFDCQEQTREMVEKYVSGNWSNEHDDA